MKEKRKRKGGERQRLRDEVLMLCSVLSSFIDSRLPRPFAISSLVVCLKVVMAEKEGGEWRS